MSDPELRREAARAKRIVVKIGSGTLTEAGRVRGRVVSDLARQVAALFDAGREVVVVSSGAIAIGSRTLGWKQPGPHDPGEAGGGGGRADRALRRLPAQSAAQARARGCADSRHALGSRRSRALPQRP